MSFRLRLEDAESVAAVCPSQSQKTRLTLLLDELLNNTLNSQTIQNTPISLQKLEILEVVLAQKESFRSAVGLRQERRALYLRWWDRDGAWGIGECSCRPDPHYSAEFNDAVALWVESYAFPRLPVEGTLSSVDASLSKVRGWPFARAALLDAVFDLLRRRGGPDALDAVEPRVQEVPAGISLGIFQSAAEAVARVDEALSQGYRRVKLKVHSSMDPGPLKAIREHAPSAPLAFDANGTCTRADLDTFLPTLAELDPLFIEQPFSPSRLDLCRELKRRLPKTRICLDESIKDRGDLLTAIEMDALDLLNLKPGRVGGQWATVDMLTECDRRGIPVWIGGMFETGVGRAANLRVAARTTDAGAHDLSPSSRYFARDIVAEPLEMNASGHISAVDQSPVDLDEATLLELTQRRIVLETSP